MQMGEMHAINDVIDFDTAALLAEELSLIHICASYTSAGTGCSKQRSSAFFFSARTRTA